MAAADGVVRPYGSGSNSIAGTSPETKSSSVRKPESKADLLKSLARRLTIDNCLGRLWTGADLNQESMDGAVNALALMNGLILTIPYSIMTTLDWDYWDKVSEYGAPCARTGYDFYNSLILGHIVIPIYSSCSGLILATLYYLFKPKDIQQWWGRGRFFLLLMCGVTAASVISVLQLACDFLSYSAMKSSKFCSPPSTIYRSAMYYIVLASVLGFALFF